MKITSVAKTFDFMLSHDPSQLRFTSGLRNAVGVFIVLMTGILTGQLLIALSVAIGAQVAGFAGLNGPVFKRLQTMLMAATGMGITTFFAGLTAGSWVAVMVIALLGFIAGFLNSVSLEAGLIGMWGTIAFTLFSGFPHTGITQAILRGLFVLLGGLLQASLMGAVEWVHSSRVEARAVAAVYRALANYARTPSRQADLQAASSLQAATTLLLGSALRMSYRNRLEVLINTAESLRIEVVALRGMLRSLRQQAVFPPSQWEPLQIQAETLASGLDAVAAALSAGKNALSSDLTGELKAISETAETAALPSEDWHQVYACIHRIATETLNASALVSPDHQGIHDQMVHPTGSHSDRTKRNFHDPRVRSRRFQMASAWNALRANLTFHSAVFRHAVRLGGVLAAAVFLERVLPYPRSYWLPLTTLVVLRPEFATTFTRGVARVVGTLFGAVGASLLLLIPDTKHVLGAILVAVLLTTMYAVLNYNMVLFSFVLTAEVAVLLSFFQGAPAATTLADRVIYTVLGGALAFFAYLIWPTWLHRNLPEAIAGLVAAERDYVRVVFGLVDDRQMASLETYRKRARLARTNTVNLLDQAVREPGKEKFGAEQSRIGWDASAGLVTALNRMSDSLLALESHFAFPGRDVSNDHLPKPGFGVLRYGVLRNHPDVTRFGQYVQDCLNEVEARIRHPDTNLESGTFILDEISPFTKRELNEMDLPASLTSIFIRMEDNLGTMFRMLSV